MKTLPIVFLALLLTPSLLFAYTSPGNPTGWVNDFAGMLTTDEKNSLEAGLSTFTKETDAEIAVVTIPTLGDETIETYAVQLFKEWEIGQKGKDNGVLLLVSKQEHEVRVEVGYGLEPFVTDADSSRIIRDQIAPAFKNEEYGQGIASAVSSIEGLIRQDPTAVAARTEGDGMSNDTFKYLGGALVTLFYLISIMARTKSWWLGGIVGGFIGFLIGYAIVPTVIGVGVGLVVDFFLSKLSSKFPRGPGGGMMFFGGGGFGGGGGGFGGFGGGSSGGGGASGRW